MYFDLTLTFAMLNFNKILQSTKKWNFTYYVYPLVFFIKIAV